MNLHRQLLVPWLLGFFLIVNLYLTPSLDNSPRITDILGSVLALWLIWRLAATGLSAVPLVALIACGTIPLLWGLYAYSVDDMSTVVLSIRWLLAIPWGYALFAIAQDLTKRVSLVWGMWWGCLANALILLLQYYGLESLVQNLGLANNFYVTSSVYDPERVPGLHAHPNGTAAVVSLIVPLSLYLYGLHKTRVWLMLVGFSVLLVATQLTLTRSAALVALVTFLIGMIAYRDLARFFRWSGLLVLGGLLTLSLSWLPGGWDRWVDQPNIVTGGGQRLDTITSTLGISFRFPLGQGAEVGPAALLRSTGYDTAHNAFAQLALEYGIFLAAAVALLMFTLALQITAGPKTPWVLEALLAVHLIGLFSFEEQLNTPTFLNITAWLIATSAMVVVATTKRPNSLHGHKLTNPFKTLD